MHSRQKRFTDWLLLTLQSCALPIIVQRITRLLSIESMSFPLSKCQLPRLVNKWSVVLSATPRLFFKPHPCFSMMCFALLDVFGYFCALQNIFTVWDFNLILLKMKRHFLILEPSDHLLAPGEHYFRQAATCRNTTFYWFSFNEEYFPLQIFIVHGYRSDLF